MNIGLNHSQAQRDAVASVAKKFGSIEREFGFAIEDLINFRDILFNSYIEHEEYHSAINQLTMSIQLRIFKIFYKHCQ